MRKYIAFSYDALMPENPPKASPRQRKVGDFDNRQEADRAAWTAVASNSLADSAQVLRGGMQVYYVDRAAIADGAESPARGADGFGETSAEVVAKIRQVVGPAATDLPDYVIQAIVNATARQIAAAVKKQAPPAAAQRIQYVWMDAARVALDFTA